MFENKGYHNALLVSFTTTPHILTMATHIGVQIFYQASKLHKSPPETLRLLFCLSY